MINQSFDEIYNDDSLENKAKVGAKEYFKTHEKLNKEELDSFLSIIGLDTIWSTNEEKLTIWELFSKHLTNITDNTVNESSVNKGIEELFHSDNNSFDNISFSINEINNNSFRFDDINSNKNMNIKDNNDKAKMFKEAEEIIIEEQLSPRSSINIFFNTIDILALKKFKCLNIVLLLYEELSQEMISELLPKYKFISLPYDQVVGYLKLLINRNSKGVSSDNQSDLSIKIDRDILNYANATIDTLLDSTNDNNANHSSIKQRTESNHNSNKTHHKNSYASNKTKEEDASELIEKLKKMDNESLDCISAIKLLLELNAKEKALNSNKPISTQAEISFLLTQLTSIIKAKETILIQENYKSVFIEISKKSLFHHTINQYTKSKNNLYAMIDLQENLDRILKSNQTLIDQLNQKNEKIKALNVKNAEMNVQLLVGQSNINQLENLNKELQKENCELKDDLNKTTMRYSTLAFNKKDSNEALILDNFKGLLAELQVKNRKCNEMVCKKNLECANLQKALSNLTIQSNYLKEEIKRMNEFDLYRTDSISFLHEQLFATNCRNNKMMVNKSRGDCSSDLSKRKKSFSMPKEKINNKDSNDSFIPYDNISENEMKYSRDYKETNYSSNKLNTSIVSSTNKSDRSIISGGGGGGRKRRKTKSQWAFNNEKEKEKDKDINFRPMDDITNSRIDILSMKESNIDRNISETPSYNYESYIDNEIDLSHRERRYTHLSDKTKDKNTIEDNSASDFKLTPIPKGNIDLSNNDSLIEDDSLHDLQESTNIPIINQNKNKDAIGNNGNNTIREEDCEDMTMSEQSSQYHFCKSNRNSTYTNTQLKEKQSTTMMSMSSSRSNNTIQSLQSFAHFKNNLLLSNSPAYDFLNLRNNKLLYSLLFKGKDAIIPVELFSDCVYYYQENLKKIKSLLVITSKYFYIFREYDLDCKVRISRKYIGTTSISNKYFNAISFHFTTGEDILIDIYRRIELLYYLRDLYRMKKFNKLRFKFTDQFNIGAKTVNLLKDKLLSITPNLENAQKMGYLAKYNDTFFSNSFTEKYVVLADIGLIYFDDTSKPPKGIIPIIGTKIKTVVCNTENEHYYCFQMTPANSQVITFGSLIKEELESWIIELRKFKYVYKEKMTGIDTVQK